MNEKFSSAYINISSAKGWLENVNQLIDAGALEQAKSIIKDQIGQLEAALFKLQEISIKL